MMVSQNPDPLLSRAEAASYLSLKEGTLAQWASTGAVKLPYSKLGRLTMYRRSDLDAFIAKNVRGG